MANCNLSFDPKSDPSTLSGSTSGLFVNTNPRFSASSLFPPITEPISKFAGSPINWKLFLGKIALYKRIWDEGGRNMLGYGRLQCRPSEI